MPRCALNCFKQYRRTVSLTLTNLILFFDIQDEDARSALSYCLSFSSDESSLARNVIFAQLDNVMKRQIAYSKHVKYGPAPRTHPTIDFAPLPRTLQDALRPTKLRAIVITESVAPFRIVDVNACWENLCGYSYVESKGKTLGALLKGPETDSASATGLITTLLLGEDESGTTLINYTKQGRRFRNRVRVGPLKDEVDNVTHFVGILQEIQDGI